MAAPLESKNKEKTQIGQNFYNTEFSVLQTLVL